MKNKTNVLIISLALFLILSVILSFSYLSSRDINLSYGFTVLRMSVINTSCMEIREHPETYLIRAKHNDDFLALLKEKGYQQTDQLGVMLLFEKDGIQYSGLMENTVLYSIFTFTNP